MPSDQQKNHFSSQKFVDLSHQIFKPRLIGQTYTNYRRPLSVVFSFMYAGLENLKIHVSCLLIFERMIKIDQRKKMKNFNKKISLKNACVLVVLSRSRITNLRVWFPNLLNLLNFVNVIQTI